MIGWLFMAGFALLVFGGLWLFGGMKRRAFEFVAAALILGFAGYQWQGRPGLAGAPAQREASRDQITSSLIDMRREMDRNFTSGQRYLIPSDGYARRGDYVGAVQILRGGVRANPRDADLWTAIGLQLMMQADGTLPPAAKLAFNRARAADPRHPGPDYFTGLAALRDGDPGEALGLWSNLIEGDYRAGGWRAQVAAQTDALAGILNNAAAVRDNAPPVPIAPGSGASQTGGTGR